MARYFLKSLAIEGFRGINNNGDPLLLRFKSEAVNSVHAPNGVGKSSIFEALHFAIWGTVPRLAALQEAERGDSYVINKFHPSQQATIALTFAADDGTADIAITVSRDAAGTRTVTSSTGHADPAGFLVGLREDFVLVDYAGFATFIDASALERGRSFASLVGLSRYSRLRQMLDGAKRTQNINSDLGLSALEAEVITAGRSLGDVEQRLLRAHDEVTGATTAAVDQTDPLKTAVTSAVGDVALFTSLIASRSIMDFDFSAAEEAVEREEGGSARKELDTLSTTVAALSLLVVDDAVVSDIDRLRELAKQRDEAMQRIGAASLHSLLKDALAVVTGSDWHAPDQCPVCDAHTDRPLKEKLEAKIAVYDEANRLDQALAHEVASAASIERLWQIEEALEMGIAPEDRIHPALALSSRKGTVATDDLERAKTQLIGQEKRRAETVAAALQKITEIQATLPPSLVQVTRLLSAAKQFCEAVRDYEGRLPLLQKKQAKLVRLKRWKAFITSAAQIFADAESNLANDRIVEIQRTCQDLFARLVRGGPDVKPTLSRAQSSENVDLTLSDFFGLHDLSARALLSESYRNAVAAAIFLSAAAKHSGVPRFMVLDDVTSSFDAGNQFSLMDALRTRLRNGAVVDGNPINDGLQFIILSHDTSLEKYFDRLNGTPDWNHQKLQGMPPKGQLTVSTQGADRLKTQALQHLNAGQIDIGATFVRQYLEYKLGQVITKLEIPVPPDYATRGDKRTLSTYIDAITSAVDLYCTANRCILDLQQIANLQTHYVPSIVGNFVSHYETATGTPFNAYALIGVIQSVDDLVDCFTCLDATTNQKRFYRRLDRRT